MGILATAAVAVWAMLPAYLPNNVAVIAGGGRPIDGGRTWRGHRLLGDGKTWRGTLVGALAGVLLAVGLNRVRSAIGAALGIELPAFPLAAAIGLAAGAMLGDIAASLLKRQLGRARGAATPGLDQLDFVVGALVLSAVLAPRWFGGTFSLGVLAAVVVLTPVLHVGTNAIAYALGLKHEPW